jgi:hypothetical protein
MRTKLRIDMALLMVAKSRTETELPNSVMPYKLHEDPIRAMLRKDNVLEQDVASTKLKAEPRRTIP